MTTSWPLSTLSRSKVDYLYRAAVAESVSSAPATPRRLTRVLIAGSVIAAIALGVRSTFGLFLTDVTDALGTDTATFALAIAIQNLVWGLGQPIAGGIADRYGAGRVLVTGAVLYGSGVMLMANVHSEVQLYLSAGFVVGLGLAAMSFAVVLASIGRMYPEEQRSKALGIATAIGSGGQFVLVQVANAVESVGGWRLSLAVLAVIAASAMLLARPLRGNAADALAESGQPAASSDETVREAVGRAFSNRSYLLLNAGFFVCGFHVTFIGVHLIAYFEDEGISSGVAGLSWGLVGLFNIGGSYMAGMLGARHSKTRLLSIIYAARGLVITGFVLVPTSTATAVGFGALMGTLWLATVPLTGAIVAQQFGTAHSGTLFGLVFLSHQIGAFTGAYGGGWLADRAGSYATSWWIAVGLAAFATAVHFFIDEGPQSKVPRPHRPRTGLARLKPAAGLAGLGIVVVMALTPAAGAGADEGESGSTQTFFCVLHPTVIIAPD
jgi:MFS family permease